MDSGFRKNFNERKSWNYKDDLYNNLKMKILMMWQSLM